MTEFDIGQRHLLLQEYLFATLCINSLAFRPKQRPFGDQRV